MTIKEYHGTIFHYVFFVKKKNKPENDIQIQTINATSVSGTVSPLTAHS